MGSSVNQEGGPMGWVIPAVLWLAAARSSASSLSVLENAPENRASLPKSPNSSIGSGKRWVPSPTPTQTPIPIPTPARVPVPAQALDLSYLTDPTARSTTCALDAAPDCWVTAAQGSDSTLALETVIGLPMSPAKSTSFSISPLKS